MPYHLSLTDSIMDKKLLIVLVIVGAITAFIGFFIVLFDWVQAYTNGVYSTNSTEGFLKTAALIVYVYFGIRFFNRHFSSLP